MGRRLRRHSVDFLLVTKERKNDGRLLCFVFPPLQDQSPAALISSASEFAHPAIHHRRGGVDESFHYFRPSHLFLEENITREKRTP